MLAEESAEAVDSSELHNAVDILAGVNGYLQYFQDGVELERNVAFQNLGRIEGRALLRDVLRQARLARLAATLERFSLDLTHAGWWLKHILEPLAVFRSATTPTQMLDVEWLASLKRSTGILRRHLRFLDRVSEGSIRAKNVYVSYTLQLWVLMLGILVFFASIISLQQACSHP
jgi:hypothetical protein